LLLFRGRTIPSRTRVSSDGARFHFWTRVFVPGFCGRGRRLGYRADGPRGAQVRVRPARGMLDPSRARPSRRGLYGDRGAARGGGDTRHVVAGTVVDTGRYEWDGEPALARTLADTIIYEAGTLGVSGGLQPIADSGVTVRQEPSRLAAKIPYLVDLGVPPSSCCRSFSSMRPRDDFWG